MSRRPARFVFAVLLGVSLAMFLTPGGEVSPNAPNDKVVHLATFLVLAVSGRLAGVRLLALGLGLAAYAGATEVLQSVLPIDRRGDLRDLVADLGGVCLGLALSEVAVRITRRRGPA